MANEGITLIVVGILVIILTWSGILQKLPRGRRRAQMMGETNAKVLDTVIGIALIVAALIFFS